MSQITMKDRRQEAIDRYFGAVDRANQERNRKVYGAHLEFERDDYAAKLAYDKEIADLDAEDKRVASDGKESGA